MKDSDYVKINHNLIIGEVDGCIEEKNENKYLTLISKKKNLIKKINDKPG